MKCKARINYIHPDGGVFALDLQDSVEKLWNTKDFEGQEIKVGTVFEFEEYYEKKEEGVRKCSEVKVINETL